MVRTQIQLEEHQVELLKRLAAAQHASMAEVIRRAVDAYAQEQLPQVDPQVRQRAIRAAGRFASRCADLATAHDAYLADSFNQ